MKLETKRLFIGDLPDEINEQDVQGKFANYGQVEHIEIKKRDNLGPKHKYFQYAYISILISPSNLQKCFQDFQMNVWKNYKVDVQIAKENFLTRLQKEREENQKGSREKSVGLPSHQTLNGIISQSNGLNSSNENFINSNKQKQSNITSNIGPSKNFLNENFKNKSANEFSMNREPELSTLKHNKQKRALNSVVSVEAPNSARKKVLKIESVGKEPIIKVAPKLPKTKDPKRAEADMKRINSVIQMKKGYNLQKNLIKTALSNVDLKCNNKIVFDDGEQQSSGDNENQLSSVRENVNQKSLFSDEEEEENDDLNFNVKEQFLGKAGQKLLQLQSKYKNDSRFTLDSRFLEDKNENNKSGEREIVHGVNENSESGIKETDDKDELKKEKEKEFEILEQVLGTKLTSRPKFKENFDYPLMLRFDPSQPEHSKFEIKQPTVDDTKKKRKKKDKDDEVKTGVPENKPEVSKEKFYKVTDNLKEALQEKEGFSLLNLYGRVGENSDEEKNDEIMNKSVKVNSNRFIPDQNPFKYDSSDDEYDKEGINSEEKNQTEKGIDVGGVRWNEPFFYKDDDYRFQDGLDFIKRLEQGEGDDFKKVRANLKGIVKAKVKNNQRKNKPFKKKLGGNAKKKKNRIVKALNR